MKYTICVGIDSTQQSHKHDIHLQKAIFLAFYIELYCIESDSTATQALHSVSKHFFLAFHDGIYDLCGYWVH